MTHTCIANTACKTSVVDNGTRRPAFTEQPDTLCEGCIDAYRDDIGRLNRDYAMLRATLGEHRTRDGAPVHSTPTAGILIDSTSDRIMTEIVEWARFAADCVSYALKTDLPDGGRKLAQIRLDGALSLPETGSLAERQHELSRPPEHQQLAAYLAIVEPHIELLAQQAPEQVQIWSQPKRCDTHAEQIAATKRVLELARETRIHTEINEATEQLQSAYSAAGACDDCCAWDPHPKHGQKRQDADVSGLDVLQRLSRQHHLTRKHLGHTKLRYRYAMPCPYCGAPIGRDDGDSIFTCENDDCTAKGPSSWTEREYQLLAGMVGDEERAKVVTKYLLAEAYTRLDKIAALITDVADDPLVADSIPATLILEALRNRLEGHADAEHRKIADNKTTTLLRQDAQDNWAWKREPRYQKPKPKPRQAGGGIPVAPSSRSLVTDTIEPTPPGQDENYCPECELIHAGEC